MGLTAGQCPACWCLLGGSGIRRLRGLRMVSRNSTYRGVCRFLALSFRASVSTLSLCLKASRSAWAAASA